MSAWEQVFIWGSELRVRLSDGELQVEGFDLEAEGAAALLAGRPSAAVEFVRALEQELGRQRTPGLRRERLRLVLGMLRQTSIQLPRRERISAPIAAYLCFSPDYASRLRGLLAPTVPVRCLAALVHDPEVRVRRALAILPTAPTAALEVLSRDSDPGVAMLAKGGA